MECEICSRKDVSNVGMHCTVCARTSIYALRLEAARLLLEKERLGQSIEKSTSQTPPTNGAVDAKAIQRGWRSELLQGKHHMLKQKIENMQLSTNNLREEILTMRKELVQKRTALAQRRSSLQTITESVPERRRQLFDKLKQIGRRGTRSFDTINTSSVDSRAFLCREAAALLGLRQRRVRDELGHIHEQFFLANHLLKDLRQIYSNHCDPSMYCTANSSSRSIL
jgi:chromosome segregation ATPase